MRPTSLRLASLVVAVLLFSIASVGNSVSPSYEGKPLPRAFTDRLATNPNAFQFQRALLSVTERALVVRQLSSQPQLSGLAASSPLSGALSSMLGGTATNAPSDRVQGRRNIPVLLLDFPESGANSFTPAQLSKELFDGPWPTGTLTEYYSEISNGALEVRGSISPWFTLSKPATYYAGADYQDSDGNVQHCYGICPQNSKIGDLIREALAGNKSVDWRSFDNDGPDDQPNTADDDGFVDFVAFVHAGRGGECGGEGNANIWSHRGSLTLNLGLQPIVTASKRPGGGFIKIDDYVVLPALACDGSTMISIGVIAHEFGHAFGLPDLYDTSGHSAGLGNWDLMATGAWGGDNASPQTPSHMSAWSKQFLGWIDVKDVIGQQDIQIQPIERSHTAYKVKISNNQYYLLSTTDKSGFNAKLPTSGLVILQVNDSIVKVGLRNNTVNADVDNMGVKLIEADGLDRLKAEPFRGDPSDLFPGQLGKRSFDSTTHPSSIGNVAICHIPDPSTSMVVSVNTMGRACATAKIAAPAPVVVPVATAPPAPPTSPPTQGQGATPATPNSEKLTQGTNVVVKGVLVNAGSNYFDRKTRRIVLKADSGQEIDVTTSLPLSIVPNGNRPPGGTLSDFLDKKVEIKGVVEKEAVGDAAAKLHANEFRVISNGESHL